MINGLVMAAGGARAAYQAGVLRGLGKLPSLRGHCPFSVLEGVSAGAINAAFLATGAADFPRATADLAGLWCAIRPSDVIRTDVRTLAGNALRWLRDVLFGGRFGVHHAHSLLNAEPLRGMLSRHFRSADVQASIDSGVLRALAVVTTDYGGGATCVFVHGRDGLNTWENSRGRTLKGPIGVEHLCASSAIPLVFPPVRLHTPWGPSWFGDGCLRLPAPLGPAIRLGAERLIAIGIARTLPAPHVQNAGGPPSIAQMLGVSLNSLFMHQLDSDCAHVARLNRALVGSKQGAPVDASGERMRVVPTLMITPSEDVGALALRHRHRLPGALRHLLRGLGPPDADLTSYLLFDGEYTSELAAMGERDASARRDEIEHFLLDHRGP